MEMCSMSTERPGSLIEHFAVLEDPRDEGKRRHPLLDVVVICIVAVVCGADGWVQIEAFGKAREGGSAFSGPAVRCPIPRHVGADLLGARAGGI